MQTYITRKIENQIEELRDIFPVVAIIGSRQSGKSTLVKHIGSELDNFIYLDLESPRDLNKLYDPELFFEQNKDAIICIDEIQRKPELFPALRSITDRYRKNGRILILGSASRELIEQSSETLAGRIAYTELSGFSVNELHQQNNYDLIQHWLRGGFPLSYLQKTEKASIIWRQNFIRTIIERDLSLLGSSPQKIDIWRLLSMCAHNQGQVVNYSKLGESLSVSYQTVKHYLYLLEQLFVLRSIEPFEANVKKRLIKSPKIYIRDSGILHALLGLDNFNQLLGHPVYGASWEGFAMENIINHFPDWQPYFYRTSSGIEADLILTKNERIILLEFKVSTAPKLTRSFHIAKDDIKPEHSWIICPINEQYAHSEEVTISGINEFITRF